MSIVTTLAGVVSFKILTPIIKKRTSLFSPFEKGGLRRICRSSGILCSFFLFLLLAGCSSISHHGGGPNAGQDHAPNFNIDVDSIPDAIPQAEPFSKYGNPRSYVACGRRYYVMRSSRGYCATGIASWYGMKFHKVRTSSGELYDVAKMTAAHCTLPIPCYARVTNLKTGKRVIVKINDRGPFVANRLIDLSYCAAKKLGVTAHGTALVEVCVIDPCHPQVIAPVHISRNPRLYLQIGAFGVQANAEQLAEKVRQCVSYPVTIKEGVRNDQPIYRVQIGPLPTVDDSDEVYRRLKTAGLGKPIAVVQ